MSELASEAVTQRVPLDTEIELPTAADTEALGERLADGLGAGDLVVLTGPLGAGKTVLVRGLARGLGVTGAVTSPTFVIARVHPALADGPPLVHVDAYRVGDALEVADLDLAASVDDAVTLVEWGDGKVEALAPSYLVVRLERGSDDGDRRRVGVEGHGPRWTAAALDELWAAVATDAA